MASKRIPEETPSSSGSSEEGESSSSSDGSSESSPIKSSLKKPPPPPPSQPQQHSPPSPSSDDETDDEDNEEGSDTDSEEDGSPQKPEPEPKPITTQRNHPKVTNITPVPSPAPITTNTKSSVKRPLDAEKTEKESKPKKKKVADEEETEQPKKKKGGGDGVSEENEETEQPKKKKSGAGVSEEDGQKKKVAPSPAAADALEEDGQTKESEKKKVWSGEDEIAFLKGMINFEKHGKKVHQNWDEFFDFIKGKLHFEVTRQQIQNKYRSFKNKYINNLAKEKKGGNLNLKNAHDEKVYQLSKKIWAGVDDWKSEGVEGNNAGDGKKGNKTQKTSNGVTSKGLSSLEGTKLVSKGEGDFDDFPCLNTLVAGSGTDFRKVLPFLGAPSKRGLMRLDSEKRKEFEGRWRKLFEKKAELFVEEVQLAQETNKAAWDAAQDEQQ